MEIIPAHDIIEQRDGGHLVTGQQSRAEDQVINPVMAYLLRLESARSREVMRNTLDRIATLMGVNGCENIPWNSIRRNHVQMLLYQLDQQGLAPATRNRYLSAIKGVAEEAWLGGGMSSDSFQRIKAVRGIKATRLQKTGRVIPKRDIEKLLASPGSRPSLIACRDRAIMAVMLTTGVRKSELRSIKTTSLNLDELFFTVIRKGGKEAKVFLQPASARHINDWLSAKPQATEYLFCPISRGGRPLDKQITATGITHILKRVARDQDVTEFSPHDTRRTFATKLFDAGVDPIKIRDAMGHASLETTQIYNIADEEKLRSAIAVAEDLI